MKKLNEYNDSWDAMLPVNINRKSAIPKLDITSLYSEEDFFKTYDIRNPKSIEILGAILQVTLQEFANPVAPFVVLHHIKTAFNRKGYDIDLSADRMSALKSTVQGYVDFPITAGTSPLYPYQIDQTYPGHRIEDDGIQSKLGYSLSLRIHVSPTTVTYDDYTFATLSVEGEIVPQEP